MKQDLFEEVKKLTLSVESKYDRESLIKELVSAKLTLEIEDRRWERLFQLMRKLGKGFLIICVWFFVTDMIWSTMKYYRYKNLIQVSVPEIKETLIELMKEYKK